MKNESIKGDLERIDRLRETEIDYSDIRALDESFIKKATIAWPPNKDQVKSLASRETRRS